MTSGFGSLAITINGTFCFGIPNQVEGSASQSLERMAARSMKASEVWTFKAKRKRLRLLFDQKKCRSHSFAEAPLCRRATFQALTP